MSYLAAYRKAHWLSYMFKIAQMLSNRAVNTPVISAWSQAWLHSALQHGQARTPYREESSYALISEN